MVTASHNPAKYNGYKAYGPDGCQMTDDAAAIVYAEIQKTDILTGVKYMPFAQGVEEGLIRFVGDDCKNALYEAIESRQVRPGLCKTAGLKLVYSPLNGSGLVPVTRVLKDIGITDITIVPEQEYPNGYFTTCSYPNPEIFAALEKGLDLAKETGADLMLATDPDADRVGIACKDDKGEWVLINGNQTCMMYLYYILTQYKQLGKIKGNEFCVKTIVTTELIKKIADKNNIEMLDCYTGFKWIAREIRLREGKKKYIGGGEESYGFLAEDFVRDKDAVSACCLIAEVAAWAKDNGKSLYQLLLDIYVEYGFSKEFTVNVVKPGKSGAEEIKAMMENFRANPPKELGGSKVILSKDYKTLKQTDDKGNVTAIDMPEPSNVLQYFTEDGSKVSVRPSGTEPKIKFYMEVQGEMGCRNCYASAESAAMEKIEAVKKSLGI